MRGEKGGEIRPAGTISREVMRPLHLTKAAALRTQPATLVEVALSIGYDSEVAFSEAFKRHLAWRPAPTG